jgi:hypothetical protein
VWSVKLGLETVEEKQARKPKEVLLPIPPHQAMAGALPLVTVLRRVVRHVSKDLGPVLP